MAYLGCFKKQAGWAAGGIEKQIIFFYSSYLSTSVARRIKLMHNELHKFEISKIKGTCVRRSFAGFVLLWCSEWIVVCKVQGSKACAMMGQ